MIPGAVNAESGSPLVQSAINFSEGRRPGVVQAILDGIGRTPGVVLADWSADFDHNRMVATILGPPNAVLAAILAAAEPAVSLIDLRTHHGVHPRIGAMDVVPLVPIRNVSVPHLVEQSLRLAQELARRYDLPVYLYERSARPGRPSALPQIRARGFDALVGTQLDGTRAPDFGPAKLHPTAGATVLGVREPLVAYNVLLAEADATAARNIAASIRRERERIPQLTGVRALGVPLPSRRISQVTMNLTRPAATPLPPIFRYIVARAREAGVPVLASEVIGLLPQTCLNNERPESIAWLNFRETQVLEYWLERIP